MSPFVRHFYQKTYLQTVVLREARSSADIGKYDISVPESVHFHSDGTDVQAWFYSPLVSLFITCNYINQSYTLSPCAHKFCFMK